MDKLAPEILHNIFIQLDLKHRLECLRVCHRWWSVLNGYSLFYSVKLTRENNQSNRMINIFKQLHERATQVEELGMRITSDNQLNKRELLNIFPNVRVLRLEPLISITPSITHEAPIDLKQSVLKMECLYGFYHCELTSQLLYSNLGGRLKTLHLWFDQVIGTPTILSELKDLPVLKKLTLWYPIIKMADLKDNHNNIPSIEDLWLDCITVEAGDMPSNIIPAILVTKLKFYYFNTGNIEAHTQFYQYITKKYTNITSIDYQDIKLESYESRDKRHIHVDGVLGFPKLIGPIKNELTLFGVPDGVDPFEVLDAIDCTIKHLCISSCKGGTLFQHLSRSNQSKQVEKLTIQDTRADSIHVLKSMLALTKLSISIIKEDGPFVHLEGCLAACSPSLKTLSINIYSLVVRPSQIRLNSIETLSIGCMELGSDLGDIISSCFPNLVELNL
jgi:hypothetical protein